MATPDEMSTGTVPATVTVPLDTIVDLTICRIQQRRQTSFRWVIGVVIGLTTLSLGVVTLVVSNAEKLLKGSIDDRLRDETEARAPNRLGYLRDSTPFVDAPPAPFGTTTVNLRAHDVGRFALQIQESGTYRIEAVAVEEGLDPVLYLYQLRASRTAVDAIAYNDDYSGFNSRIDVELDADVSYYVELEELEGLPGPIDLTVERTD